MMGTGRSSLLSGWIMLRINGLKYKFDENKIGETLTKIKDGVIDIDMLAAMLQQDSITKDPKSFEEALQWFSKKYSKLISQLADLE